VKRKENSKVEEKRRIVKEKRKGKGERERGKGKGRGRRKRNRNRNMKWEEIRGTGKGNRKE
jgi:hypothetical protein